MKGKPFDPARIVVQILEAKPNKMFSEEQRAGVRFLRYSRAIPCAECGRKRRVHWTAVYSFIAKTMQQYTLTGTTVHLPLTPVCRDHLLAPAPGERTI